MIGGLEEIFDDDNSVPNDRTMNETSIFNVKNLFLFCPINVNIHPALHL